MADSLRIALAQVNLTVGDILGNARKVVDYSLRARDELQAQVVVFPELTLTGYPPEDLLLREDLLVWVERGLALIRQQVKGIDVVLGLPEQGAQGLFNTAVVIRDGQVLARYHKQHLPNYSVFDEMRYFVPGPAEPCVYDCHGLRVGITICEDIWMPDPAAQAEAAGAQLILNLNASPFHSRKLGDREAVLADRATETGLPVVYVNLVGGQDELVFDGGSMVTDRNGEVCLRAAAFEECLACVNVADDGRVTANAGDVGTVGSRTERMYQALVLGVRDYAHKNGFRGAVLGLSGGIDSALTLAIAVDALGAENVEAVMMPSPYTARMSIEDAAAEAEALGIEYREISIAPAFEAFRGMLAEAFAGLAEDVTEENLQARSRGVVLMAISNKKGRLLLTTGNKSEMAVGYATLYGDMAGGFAPLKDVPKLQVYELARYRNSLSSVIPQRVLERAPSAELAPNQTDQDSLPPYEVLDAILERYVERDCSVENIVAEGFDEVTVRRVVRMVNLNEYKRRQAPPGVRVTRRAFGRDRRYPITSGYVRQKWPPGSD